MKNLSGEVEDDDEEFIGNDTRDLLSPQSLWPVSPVFWEGPVPWDLPPPSQSRVDYRDYVDWAGEPFMIGTQSAVGADQYAKENPYSSTSVNYSIPSLASPPFLHGSPGLNNRKFKSAAEKGVEGKAPFSRKRRREQSRHGHKYAAVEEAQSAQQPATKKVSRAWEEHEKVLSKVILEEVLLEGTHARTEERWKVISNRLSNRCAIDRTWTAVKK